MKLTAKDRAILHTLDFDARMPISGLAKKIGMSRQACKYRLDLLREKNVIQGFYADINVSKTGFSIYLVYLCFHNISVEQERDFISHVTKQKNVGVSVEVHGSWDYCVGVWAENVVQFREAYERIIGPHRKYVKQKTVMIETAFWYFKPNAILEKKSRECIVMTETLSKANLDRKDSILLQELARDARSTLAALGEKTMLTANAVKCRIRALERKKVILGYRVMINYELLGFLHYRVFLYLQNANEGAIREFLRIHPAVISVTKTIGYCDLEFRAVVPDIYAFYALMETLRRAFPSIADYHPLLYHTFHHALNYFPL